MKRQKSLYMLLSLFVVLILALAACQQLDTPEPEQTEMSSEETEVEDPVDELVEEPTEEAPPTPDPILQSILDEINAIREELEELSSKNCTVAADGQTYSASGATYSASGAGDALLHLNGDELSHGDLVFQKFVQLLYRLRDGISNGAIPRPPDGAPVVAILVVDDFSRAIPQWGIDEVEWLRLIAVDTEGFNTETGIIADRITGEIAQLRGEGLERFVINMSFAIVPCRPLSEDDYNDMVENDPVLSHLIEVLENLLSDGFGDAELLAEAAAGFLHERALLRSSYEPAAGFFDPDGSVENYFGLLGDDNLRFLQEDPLIQRIEELSQNEHVISVAAAGNAALDFPFAPAMWKGVLSVSADAAYANAGEVVANDVVTFTLQVGETKVIHGTSFAAPELSVWAAYYLMQGHGAECNGLRPPLAYMAWDNLSLPDAAGLYCDTFPVGWPP
jgi:hypothetical protein